MALPSLIFERTSGGGLKDMSTPGPLKIGSSYYWVRLNTALTATEVWKADSDDPTGTWTAQDTANRPTSVWQTYNSMTFAVRGTDIYILHQRLTTALIFHIFSTATDTWTTVDQDTGATVTGNTDDTNIDCGIRSDGSLVCIYQTADSDNMGTNYNRVGFAVRSPTGTWTVDIAAGLGSTKSTTYEVGCGGVLADTANNRFHGFFYLSTALVLDAAATLKYSTLLSDNSLGHSNTTIDSSCYYNDTYNQNLMGCAFTDGANRKVRYMYNESGLKLKVAGFNDADSPSASVVATSINGTNIAARGACLVVYGTTQHLLYVSSDSTTLYHDKTGAGDDTWGTDDVVRGSLNTARIRGGARVYTRASDVIAFAYYNNDIGTLGGYYYDEYVLAAAASLVFKPHPFHHMLVR